MDREWKTCPCCNGYKAGLLLPFDQDYCYSCNGRGEVYEDVDEDDGCEEYEDEEDYLWKT